MKTIYKALLVGFILTGSFSIVQAKEYPASDFQPKVVYKDESYKPSSSSSSSASSSATDSKYPAADFRPKVVYKDSNYKPRKSTKSSRNTSTGSSSSTSTASTETAVKAEKKEDSDMTLVIGLVVLIAAGLFYAKGKSAPSAKQPARRKPSYKKVVAAGEGQSRVAKYLAEKQGGATGVAKYLSSKKGSASSSVAKYLAKRKVAGKQVASGKSSSVDRYLRNRG